MKSQKENKGARWEKGGKPKERIIKKKKKKSENESKNKIT
jgi:hypothetical protein